MVDKEVRPPAKFEQLDHLVVCLRQDCRLVSPDALHTQSHVTLLKCSTSRLHKLPFFLVFAKSISTAQIYDRVL